MQRSKLFFVWRFRSVTQDPVASPILAGGGRSKPKKYGEVSGAVNDGNDLNRAHLPCECNDVRVEVPETEAAIKKFVMIVANSVCAASFGVAKIELPVADQLEPGAGRVSMTRWTMAERPTALYSGCSLARRSSHWQKCGHS